jgi:hypothetical protein
MATIDASYFFGELNVAQKSDSSVGGSLSIFIDEHEERLLTGLFGYELYKAYKTGIAVLPTPDPKWTDIRDGKEYTNRSGILTKWKGLKFTDGTAKKSLVANYVYWHWMQNEISVTTGTGEKVASNQNAINAPSAVKMVRAWNQMVNWINELIEFLLTKKSDYPEFQTHYSRIPRNLLRKQNTFSI